MKLMRCLKAAVWMFASLGLLLGNQVALAAGPADSAQRPVKVADVELGEGGVLTGRVVDSRGLPQSGVAVSLSRGQDVAVTVKSDGLGVFRVAGLKGGMYRIVVKDGASVSRLWAADTAPPHANDSLMLVSGEGVLAAQVAPLKVWLADPFIMAGIVAVAVAVPVALAASRDSGS